MKTPRSPSVTVSQDTRDEHARAVLQRVFTTIIHAPDTLLVQLRLLVHASVMASIKIPNVDLASYHDRASTPTQRQATAAALASACHTLGFVAITNHGIPPSLLADAFATSKSLFSLPHSDKMKAPHPAAAMPHRGYSAPGLEKVYSKDEAAGDDSSAIRKITDYKESYEIGSDADPVQQNIWLPEEVLPGFRAFTTEFYNACNEVGNIILTAMADGMGLDEGEQRDRVLKMNGQMCNQLRLLHYPEVEAGKLQGEVLARMPAHTDWGGCTMLFQDGVGGLELQDPESKEWVRAIPEEGACVVNVGDFLERLTNGKVSIADKQLEC